MQALFGLAGGATLTELRVEAEEGPCRVGLEYRHGSSTDVHRSFEVWSYAPTSPAGVTCEPSESKNIPPLFHAVEQLAGLGVGPIAIHLRLHSHPELLQRYLDATAPLAPDAAEAVVAKHLFDREVFSPWQPFIDGLGYRLTGVELFRLEAVKSPTGAPSHRMPVRVSLILEPKGPRVARGDRSVAPRTMASVFAIPFDISSMMVELRGDLGACAPTVGVGNGRVQIGGDPEGCRLTEANLAKDLPPLFHAAFELVGPQARTTLVMTTQFTVLPVLEKWIPVSDEPPERDYAKLSARMRSAGIFAHLDPFFAGIGYALDRVSIEKLTSERGAALLKLYPSLASTGLTAKDRTPVPLMTTLTLVPR